jgi:hypothetical protein
VTADFPEILSIQPTTTWQHQIKTERGKEETEIMKERKINMSQQIFVKALNCSINSQKCN